MKPTICSLSRGIQIATLLLACTIYPLSSLAQSVDDCMSSRQADAVNVCQSVLASGSRSVDVYWKLTSAQFQDGQQEQANKTLDDALKLHPGNKRLVALREIIAAVETEKALIIRSSKVDQSFVNKGAAKIACLTKTGNVAILACQQRLEMTNEDGDRIRVRLALLESQQPSTTVASTPAPTKPAATTPIKQPPIQVAIAEPTAEQLATKARKKAYKSLVVAVQTQLNEFGFNTGFPDGVAGGKTRNALTDFYTTLGVPAVTTITAATLDDLTREKDKLISAQQLLRQSERTIEQGNAQLATQQLADARNTSSFLEVPARLEQALRSTQIATATVLAPVVSQQPIQASTATQTPAVAQLPTVAKPIVVTQLPAVTKPVVVAQIPTVTEPAVVTQLPTVTQPVLVARLPTVTQPAAVTQQPIVTTTPAIVQTTADVSQQFAQLMGQISVLHKQIRRKQTDQVAHLDRMRNVL